ncbi:hypothetical protein PENSTE_c019G03769 [Penicillium steckii]|uniref:Uncharacterized protein n=1 Tax=Penicillium steckii TaxID=303698 RepID=A0A1V6SW59_9EURO|nr:hypothetical protein PENSTE_c019G03769 [Penicillium steckii]
MAPERVLHGFNDKLPIEEAYGWSKEKILDFMDDVAINPQRYEIQDDQRPAIERLVREIRDLCPPDGSSYKQEGLEPDQMTKRILNKDWNPSSRSSKFLLNPFVYKHVPFTGLFDLVGAFLSIKTAPVRATPNNFYIPLMGMYEQWCRNFHDNSPKMVQCTWISHREAKCQFFLGASCAGYRTGPQPTGSWDMVVRNGRWDLIYDGAMRQRGYKMYKCPQTQAGSKVWFGNCAETIPLVVLLR